ncbi:MAG: hypothetical protein R2828_29900 [Saprospiraceae bacterium]
MQAQPIELMGDGKDHVKISGWQKLILLLNGPHFLVEPLTLGAVAVTTTIVTDAQVPTSIASIYMAAQPSGTTVGNGLQGAAMAYRQMIHR